MIDPITRNERDAVLLAFHDECERKPPTANEILSWIKKYPQFAEDIRAHAAVALDWATGPAPTTDDESDCMIAKLAFSQTLNLMFDADQAKTSAAQSQNCESLHQVLAHTGKTLPQLARELDVGREVLADLFNGWMCPPLSKRLVAALKRALSITDEQFVVAFDQSSRSPQFGYARAEGPPRIRARPFEQIIRESNMSEERKRFWLEE
jgi:hypothetical protein